MSKTGLIAAALLWSHMAPSPGAAYLPALGPAPLAFEKTPRLMLARATLPPIQMNAARTETVATATATNQLPVCKCVIPKPPEEGEPILIEDPAVFPPPDVRDPKIDPQPPPRHDELPRDPVVRQKLMDILINSSGTTNGPMTTVVLPYVFSPPGESSAADRSSSVEYRKE